MKRFEDKLDKLMEMITLHIPEKDPKLTKTDYKPLKSNLEHGSGFSTQQSVHGNKEKILKKMIYHLKKLLTI